MFSSIREIEAPELAKRLEQAPESIKVIDVRQMPEIMSGTVPGAEAIPMHTVPLKVADLDKSSDIAVLCRSGARSAQVVMFLQQQGFENVYNVRGGMMAWANSGNPVTLPQAS